jgi:hypothetical protein
MNSDFFFKIKSLTYYLLSWQEFSTPLLLQQANEQDSEPGP